VTQDPTGHGKFTWVKEPVRFAPAVGYLHHHVFIRWGRIDRIPANYISPRANASLLAKTSTTGARVSVQAVEIPTSQCPS
jgi:hypothetical protein